MIAQTLKQAGATFDNVDFWSIRHVDTFSEEISVRQGVLEPVSNDQDSGCMVVVHDRGGMGYSATSNASKEGLRQAFEQARRWAWLQAEQFVVDSRTMKMPKATGTFATPVKKTWESMAFKDKVALLKEANQRLAISPRIVDRESGLCHTKSDQVYVTSDGSFIEQSFSYLVPDLRVTADNDTVTQIRSLAGHGICRQSGLELLDEVDLLAHAPRVAQEALDLLEAPDCPSGKMDLLLAPDQMILQIHESIGHPLELDRILGDERNYAGTSFVTPQMFGSYQYGSNLLNITYDPHPANELASYAFDDEGLEAKKTFIIRDGILERPLGASWSQQRSGLNGVANARACNWNRAPIDRMANLNLEPGTSTFDEMVKSIERGVFMKANSSWSIDDSRNKFQFGCEWAQLIENGKLTTVVKNPNYRGISATFWRNLRMVGNVTTADTLGATNCGKGEPNQSILVGHSSPTCLFANVDVFGGD